MVNISCEDAEQRKEEGDGRDSVGIGCKVREETVQRFHENKIACLEQCDFEILAMSLNFEDLELGGTDANFLDELMLFRDAVFTGRTLPFLFAVVSEPSFRDDSEDEQTDEDAGDHLGSHQLGGDRISCS